MRRIFAILFPLLLPSVLSAQISTWQLGGSSGLAWSASDSVRIFIDFDSVPGAIQPIYLTSAQTVFSHLDNWSPWKSSRRRHPCTETLCSSLYPIRSEAIRSASTLPPI